MILEGLCAASCRSTACCWWYGDAWGLPAGTEMAEGQ